MAGGLVNFHGVVPPVSTPFTEDYGIDAPSLERHLRFLLDAGVHGLFVLGSTSETAYLTDAQRAQVLDVAVRTVAGQVPIVAGTMAMATTVTIEHARVAQRAGVDGLVVTSPFYARVGQREIVAHFRRIKEAVDLPLIAYDVPPAVHHKLERDTVLHLAREGVIVGLKDSSGDDVNFRDVVMATRDLPGFAAFTGSELLVDGALLYGADGVVPGLGNVDPAGYVRLYDAAHAGDWAAARREQERLFRLFEIIYTGLPRGMGIGASAMGGFKTALMLRGVIATNVTAPPQTRYAADEVEQVRAALVTAGLL